MGFYLESQDGSQSYLAKLFCKKKDLVHGQLYTLEELDFSDWLRISTQHKPPQKKLVANWYGPKYPHAYKYWYAAKCLWICPRGKKISTALWALGR